ncbi:MAG: universal stress protein [Paracoccaceae bacterium]|nr:universal stress protein [Paracoccaceae bacterium]
MKRILAATDLSERSDRAVSRALALGAALGAEVEVVTVIDHEGPDTVVDRLRRGTEDALDRLVEAAGAPAAGHRVLHGKVVDALLQHEGRCGAGLLVLGLHRPHGLFDGLRETTLERLVRMGRTPVLLVRNPAAAAYDKVLAPVSFSPACGAALRVAHAIAPGAAIATVHALEVPFGGLVQDEGGAMAAEALRKAADTAAAWAADHLPEGVALPEIAQGALREVISARLKGVDLLAIGAHTRHGLAGATLGSLAAEFLRDPPTDLLVARA